MAFHLSLHCLQRLCNHLGVCGLHRVKSNGTGKIIINYDIYKSVKKLGKIASIMLIYMVNLVLVHKRLYIPETVQIPDPKPHIFMFLMTRHIQ